jgi:glycosyltransferase involved in cell wall biosynthesis
VSRRVNERPLGAGSAAPSAPAKTSRRSNGNGSASQTTVIAKVTVIVPVLNGEHLIGGCLAALDAQTIEERSYEVIVVDDGSTDATREIVGRFAATSRAHIRLLAEPHRGPAGARNAGLAAASSELIAFTDADCEVAPDWLATAIGYLDADPTLDAIEGRTIPKGEVGTFTHQMRNVAGGLFMTCNMIYRRAGINGGFDERFKMAFLEDSDVAFGLLGRGGRIEFMPDVLAEHLVLKEGRRKFWREARKRFYNPLLASKHPVAYRHLLRPVVPGIPAPYLDYLVSLSAMIAAVVTGAWVVVPFAGLAAAWMFRRVAHVLRARDPRALVASAAVPFVQAFWVGLGMIRFRYFDPRI